MYRIRSRRVQGAMVEVIQKGKKINRHIAGLGVDFSERLTDDILFQEELGNLIINRIGEEREKKAEPVIAPAPISVPEPEPEPEAEVQEEEPEVLAGEEDDEVILYAESDYEEMPKKQIQSIAEVLGVEIKSKSKKALIEELLTYDIPKG